MLRAARHRYRFPLIARILGALLTGWVLCVAVIYAWSHRSAAGHADAIVVLGAAQYSGRPSPVLRARLDHALGLWKADRARYMVLTGGRRPGDLISEAAAGRRYLIRRGVPTQMILLEPAGRTSLASVEGAAQLLHAQRDALPRAVRDTVSTRPSVLLVSDPFHMLRLEVLARLHGLRPLPSPTRTSPISANRAVAVEYMLRESIALPTDVMLMLWLTVSGGSANSP
jgi:vancomycin permeability regulator SanA